ncbi:MarR family transcriptional regulator [Shewanella corallii]|uniref:MarR family transcriptional regulator n=1 Tax=Shewanella corallii TaxID=560080 RepID=A0ABT0N4K5_9GAMM|nr:MarR family transcriptional regulator [Shewanella corallii]MCL2913290.1 MarR family transcriptional regulator [Shewanella corallii]
MNEKQQPSLLLHHFIPYRLANLADTVSTACSKIYRDTFGLSIPEWRILARLAEQDGLNSKLIGRITFMDKSKVSRAVKQLEDKGLLVRSTQQDKRVCQLSLTKKGLELYNQLVPIALEWESELLSSLSITEYRDLLRILEKLDVKAADLSNSDD